MVGSYELASERRFKRLCDPALDNSLKVHLIHQVRPHGVRKMTLCTLVALAAIEKDRSDRLIKIDHAALMNMARNAKV